MAADNVLSASKLEQFRHYLALLARMQIGPRYQAKIAASDIVQQTLIDAHQQWDRFRGSTHEELTAWLKRILSCNLGDAFRAVGRAKRDIHRELSIDQSIEVSSSRLENWLAAVQTSPSGKAVRNEQLLQLATALGTLLEAERDAIELHHLHGWSLAEVAEHLGRTDAAVVGLLRRGLKKLRKQLEEPSEENRSRVNRYANDGSTIDFRSD